MWCGGASAPDPEWGANSAPPSPLLFRGGGGGGEGGGRGGEGNGEGRGGLRPPFPKILDPPLYIYSS